MYCLNVAFCRAFLLGLLFIAAGLCFHPDSRLAAAAEEQRVLRAGAYAADITPTYFPVSTTPHRDHQVSEVHDRLYARCVVLDDGQTRIAIVICDNNMIPRKFLDAAKAGLNKIRQYLMNTPPINLHQRSMLLLGSLHVDDIMTEAERKTLVADLFAVQKQDGGWNIVSLGHWKRHDGKPDDTQSSDGYGTGFSIYVLRQAGVPADDPRIQAGIAWLKANQRASGRWFTRSQWEDRRHYLSRLGTAFAIRALVACGEH